MNWLKVKVKEEQGCWGDGRVDNSWRGHAGFKWPLGKESVVSSATPNTAISGGVSLPN